MSLWSRLFGEKETPAQKLVRARTHVDDGELELAVRVLVGIEGAEADELRSRAREGIEARVALPAARVVAPLPDPDDPLYDPRPHAQEPRPKPKTPKQARPPRGALVLHGLSADGSMTIEHASGSVTLNAPVADVDQRPRSSDALAIAERVVESVRTHPLDPRAFAFVDAVLVLARAGTKLPRMIDSARQAILELAVAASDGDPARVVAAIRATPPDHRAPVAYFAQRLAVRFAARELGDLAVEGLVFPGLHLIGALAAIDPVACARVIERASDSPQFAARAWLLAADAGFESPALAARWLDWQQIAEPDLRAEWLALAVCREARRDLDAALALEAQLPASASFEYGAAYALAVGLAKRDPARALALARARDPHLDQAGWLAGCVRGRVAGTVELVDAWIDALGPMTFDPFGYFSAVLAAAIELGDVDRTRRCLARAGAVGWQVACAAWDPLALAAARGDGPGLLAACYERHAPGVVSGRAIARGAMPLGAGNMVFQPAWLDFTEPQPVETLALVVALGAHGPAWHVP